MSGPDTFQHVRCYCRNPRRPPQCPRLLFVTPRGQRQLQTGESWPRVGRQGSAGGPPEEQEGASRAVEACGQGSSRRWGGSDLYSGHCTKLPHLIGHLRSLREKLASSTGTEGVGGQEGMSLWEDPTLIHRAHMNINTNTIQIYSTCMTHTYT